MEDVLEAHHIQPVLLHEVFRVLVQFAQHIPQVGLQEQHTPIAVNGDAPFHAFALPWRPGIGVGAHAEVVDEQDAICSIVEKPLDHVAAHESAAAGDEVCCHRRKDAASGGPRMR